MSEVFDRYKALGHAMQTGVAYKMQYHPQETDPKHLRTGLNSTFVETASLARLMMEKGIFTLEEYEKTLAEEMAKEVERYELWLGAYLGSPVTLG